jgi:hypothetical protein
MEVAANKAPVAWPLLLALAALKLAVHFYSTAVQPWGYAIDELYFLDSVDRLDWGFVDHPPFSVAVLALVRAVLGDSLLAIRALPAALGSLTILLTGLIAREMGGGRAAQGLAALAVLGSGVYLAMGSFYSMNPIDQAIWASCALILLRIANGGPRALWLVLGVAVGIGLQNKVSVVWLAGSVGVGLLLTPERRWLRTPWPWIAASIALVIFLPFLVWEWRHGWPFVEFSRSAARFKVGVVTPLDFFTDQLLVMGPLAAPLGIGGMVYGFVKRDMRSYRSVAWIFLATSLILLASGSSRLHYLAPAFPIALALGGVATERLAVGRSWIVATASILLFVEGAVAAPIALPMLSPAATVRYEKAIGLRQREELARGGRLPVQLGLLFHAEAVLQPVLEIFRSLAVEDRERVEILTGSFGEAGAINVLGRKRGLPRAIGMHNQYWLWGPGDATGELMIVVHGSTDQLLRWFQHCDREREIDCPYCMEAMDAKAVHLCRNPRAPLKQLWPEMKLYR